MPKTWFITGASRGLGAAIAKSALKAGDNVVATARVPASIAQRIGPNDQQLHAVPLAVEDSVQASAAVSAGLSRFGQIDFLVNNAGFGYYGFFEESTPDEVSELFATNLFGVLNVTRAVLPHMRSRRAGRIFNLSSLGGLVGAQLGSLYCASKFALEGFSESLAKEIAPFGIFVTIVEPGPFRTEFLSPQSIRKSRLAIPDYESRRAALLAGVAERNGRQPGDPERLAQALITLARTPTPPLRFLAGEVANAVVEEKLAGMRGDFDAWRELSLSTDGIFDATGIGGMFEQIR